jgi:activator of Hsp90 ATPase protein 1
MAALDEADPRWIVEKRADGRNVGNWHWTETDYTNWTAEALRKELADVTVIDDVDMDVVTTTCHTKGEVSVSTRKGKVITFYELDCTVEWTGTITETGEAGEGEIRMPYISEENDYDDFEVQVSAKKDTKDEKFRMKVREAVIPMLRERVPRVLRGLQEQAREKQLLPQGSAPLKPAESTGSANANAAGTSKAAAVDEKVAAVNKEFKAGSALAKDAAVRASSVSHSGKFQLTDKFNCAPDDLWMALTDANRVRAYAGGDAVMTTEVGGKFALFGGAVSGEIVSADQPKKLVQKWRAKDWPVDHFSHVTIELEYKDGKTVMTINQKDVPDAEVDRTKSGWSSNFSARIKGVFGYGGMSF